MMHIGQYLMRRRRKILIWAAVCLAVFAILGFFVVPPILKSVLTKQLTVALHRDVSIREVRLNPFALSATLRGFAVKEPKSPETFLSFEEMYVNLEASSLFRWGVVVREFRLTKPFIRVVRRQDESYNFSDLLVGEGVVTDEIEYMTADQEAEYVITQASTALDKYNMFSETLCWAHQRGEPMEIERFGGRPGDPP